MPNQIVRRLEALYNRENPSVWDKKYFDASVLTVYHSHLEFQNEGQLKKLKTAHLRKYIERLEADIAYYQKVVCEDALEPSPEVRFVQQQRDEDIRVLEIAKEILKEKSSSSKCIIL
ncbi:MAG: hypothetical protein KGJ02_02695 [Verrucomicrobiota bacterium]|nr:hypothetical protein [Verrucomicrobiota bacterium]